MSSIYSTLSNQFQQFPKHNTNPVLSYTKDKISALTLICYCTKPLIRDFKQRRRQRKGERQ